MGGILQPPCPCGRNIGRCCLPQTRLLAHFSPSFKLKYSHISSFHSPNTTSFHSSQLVPPLPKSSHKSQFAATHNRKNKQRIQAYRRRMKQDGTLNKLHLHQPQFLPFFTSSTSRKTLNTLPGII